MTSSEMCPSHVTLTLTLFFQGHTVFYVYLCIYVCSFPIMLPLCNPVIPPLAVFLFFKIFIILLRTCTTHTFEETLLITMIWSSSGVVVKFLVWGARDSRVIFPFLATTISEIGHLLLSSRDLAEISLKWRKSSKQPIKQILQWLISKYKSLLIF